MCDQTPSVPLWWCLRKQFHRQENSYNTQLEWLETVAKLSLAGCLLSRTACWRPGYASRASLPPFSLLGLPSAAARHADLVVFHAPSSACSPLAVVDSRIKRACIFTVGANVLAESWLDDKYSSKTVGACGFQLVCYPTMLRCEFANSQIPHCGASVKDHQH